VGRGPLYGRRLDSSPTSRSLIHEAESGHDGLARERRPIFRPIQGTIRYDIKVTAFCAGESHYPLSLTGPFPFLPVSPAHRLTTMYEKWLADDKEDLKLTKDQIAEFQAKLDNVQASQGTSGEVLAHKEVLLSQKEDVLSVRTAWVQTCVRGVAGREIA